MALTRKFLKALGIEEEKIDQIIEAHTDVVDALKADADKYKADAGKLDGVQKELDDLKASSVGDNDYKAKYEKEHADFENYKSEAAKKETRAATESLFRAELSALGITGTRADKIVRVTDMDSVKVKDGALEDAKAVQESIRADWSDFIPSTQVKGQHVHTPPANNGGKMTREEIMKITDSAARRAAIAQNLDQFNK